MIGSSIDGNLAIVYSFLIVLTVLLGLQFSQSIHLEAFRVGSVRGHHAVKGGPARREAFLLRLVLAQNEAHELAHAVSYRTRMRLST